MSKLTNCLLKKDTTCLPIWFMRQAGRYLPEFREIRSKNKDFIKLCLDSRLSSEITLQPLKRFNIDAAIIFSDILMTPYALGQEVEFKKDHGPILSKLSLDKFNNNNHENFKNKLNSVYEAIKITRLNLKKEKSLIGFIGAPWTLIVYMLGLKQDKEKIDLEKLKKSENLINNIINNLVDYLCLHVEQQVKAGADTIQIFDSWAGLIPENKLIDYCYKPNKKIVEFCKKNKIPVICFPRNINKNYLDFADFVKPDGLSLDYTIDPEWARDKLKNFTLQGGMDPKILFEKDNVIFKEVDKYLDIFKNFPYIFNLGHGLLPGTDPDKVSKLVRFFREY